VRLNSLRIRGYKTLEDVSFEPHRLAVIIGPNGAGKSNLVGAFRLLSNILGENLQEFVALNGGASRLLFDGPERTSAISLDLVFEGDAGTNEYGLRLGHAAGDRLVILEERYRFTRIGTAPPSWRNLGNPGDREAALLQSASEGGTTARVLRYLLQKVIVHQFHNTAAKSPLRQRCRIEDGRWLWDDAGNLAAVLYRLRENHPTHYRRIVETLRLALPFFRDFECEPEHGTLLLQWRERDAKSSFDASQASDGMLRLMALVTLLLQPAEDLPKVLILDEPELGLHPAAITLVAELIQAASETSQVIMATQSVPMLNQFSAGDIVVVDRQARASQFHRLTQDELADWLHTYSVAELWEKNILGGRP